MMLGMPYFVFSNDLPFNNEICYPLHPLYELVGYGIIAYGFILAHFILKATTDHIPVFLLAMSKNVTYIYVAQWMIIGFLSPLLVKITDIYLNIAIGVFVHVTSYFGGILLKKTKLILV